MSFGFALLALVFATGLPLFCAFIAVANVRRYRVKAHPCDSYQVPPDVRRRMAPWLNRMGHFGFRQVQLSRLESAGYAEAHRWILLNEEERTYATLERTVPVSGAGASVSLTMFTALRDGTLVVTADRRITHHPPAWWQDVQRFFGTVTSQWKLHYSRVRGDKERVLPPIEKFTGMLEADEQARHEAQVKGGEFVPTRQDPDILRLRFARLPSRVMPLLADFFTGRSFRSATRRDVAAPTKARVDENERVGGPIGLSVNQAVEQDLARYRALIAVRSSPLDHLRRIVVLLGTVAFFIAIFGRDQPLQTALTVLVLAALHEAGHWVPMKLFRYKGVPPVFIPFTGATERGRKLHAPAWQQLVVLLGGPLPGLIAGLAMLAHGYFEPSTPRWLLDAAGMAVALNALHLLPVLPMDGGKVIDLLVFRDMPMLRPFFTVTASLSAFAAALVLKSRVLRYIAAAMFGGVLWDMRTIQVVRGARKLPWAGEVNDESEALRRIFRGMREEGQGAFIGSEGWHKKIEALLMEVMRKRPAFITRFAGGTLLAVSGAIPALLMVGVLLGPVLSDAGRVVRNAEHVIEFRKTFPKETRQLSAEDQATLIALATETETGPEQSVRPLTDEPSETAADVLPVIAKRLDQLDWNKANIASRSNLIGARVLPIWVEVQCLQLERSATAGNRAETLERAEEMLGILAAAEPATSLERRQLLSSIELRVLSVVEREASAGRLEVDDLDRLDTRISARNTAPDPEVESLLLVAAWAERSRLSAIADAAAQASLDPRFWRDLYPRIRVVRRLLTEQNAKLVPASVALARHWKTSRRVGELPPQLGMKVAVDPGEASLILGFCEGHRRLSWRRIVTLSALRMESFRQKNNGNFPKNWKHSVPGGAELKLVLDSGPFIRLTDRLDQIQGSVPMWLTPPSLPLPRSGPTIDYDCRLYGAPPLPELSSH
ncbi:site-2 protease family protein [Luteolibacter arcticus]|uniref:Site-2 protease family protein n=1 Tax=Luteolibacter arcticus TaxID=1581411 RepID=A0ABT3GQT6_9BACT|nr:site-2 protease family protein [Luteolibacter arcticus]MCW1925854.1 site-2 protease family protein [Luteolibacter arcticus]